MPEPKKVIYTRHFPFKGFCAINIFGFIFARKEYAPLPEVVIRHEMIHTEQMKELLYVGFYILYGLEWLVRLFSGNAYKNISFEREAYTNQKYYNYLSFRQKYDWRHYL